MNIYESRLFSTYSIVARDAGTGQLGVAVQTHQMCVGAVVPWLLPGVGAIATQAMVNVAFGPISLAMLREGVPAPQVVQALIASDEQAYSRQVAVVDALGRASAWTGDRCLHAAGHHIGEGYSVQANMMEREAVIPAMAEAYEQTTGDLAARLMAALRAAQRQGGDIRGMQSAAIKIVGGEADGRDSTLAIYDLRIDEADDPLGGLERLVRLRRAELLDEQGHRALSEGKREQALTLWAQARAMAPEMEEIGFWQAVALADEPGDVPTAAQILRAALALEEYPDRWIDLLRRLPAGGLVKRSGAGDELIAALKI